MNTSRKGNAHYRPIETPTGAFLNNMPTERLKQLFFALEETAGIASPVRSPSSLTVPTPAPTFSGTQSSPFPMGNLAFNNCPSFGPGYKKQEQDSSVQNELKGQHDFAELMAHHGKSFSPVPSARISLKSAAELEMFVEDSLYNDYVADLLERLCSIFLKHKSPLMRLFHEIDQDDDGVINLEEFQKVVISASQLGNFEPPFSEEEIAALFSALATNEEKEEGVSFETFVSSFSVVNEPTTPINSDVASITLSTGPAKLSSSGPGAIIPPNLVLY